MAHHERLQTLETKLHRASQHLHQKHRVERVIDHFCKSYEKLTVKTSLFLNEILSINHVCDFNNLCFRSISKIS